MLIFEIVCGIFALVATGATLAGLISAILLALRLDYFIEHADARERVRQKTLLSDVKYSDECMQLMDAMIADVINKKQSADKKE